MLPEEDKKLNKYSLGALVFGWIYYLFMRDWMFMIIALLAPITTLILAIFGRRRAYNLREWKDYNEFFQVQKKWDYFAIIFIRSLLNAIVLISITYILPGIYFSSFYAALVTALALSIINAILKPILILFTLPINILTLGLFTLIINGALFWLVSTFIKGFYLNNFWTAIWAALIFSIISIIISWIGNAFSSKEK